MIFRNESPVPGVQGIVPVVSHHEVIILLEGVAVNLLSVDEDHAFVIDLQVVLLVGGDDALVQREVVRVKLDRFAFLRNPERTEPVTRPAVIRREREDAIGIGRRISLYVGLGAHYARHVLHLFEHRRRKGHLGVSEERDHSKALRC